MKTGKTLKLAGALAASLAFLAVLAGCGQSSKPSSQKDSTSGTSQSSTHPSSSSPLPSTSTSTPSSSSTSASASNTPSSSTSSSTPAASSSAPSSTTESRPSNEVLYLLAYIKYRGGLEAITPSDLIVDKYMIGTQKGTVLPNTLPTQVPLQMVVSGEEVEVIGPPPSPTPESTSTYSLKAVYNIDDLVSEYYSTPAQKSQINSILQEGERHNLLDVLALLKSQSADSSTMEAIIVDAYLNGGNDLAIGADTSALIVINGEDVTLCINSVSGASYPVTHQYYHFTSQSLINEYYSTPSQKAQIDKYVGLGVGSYKY